MATIITNRANLSYNNGSAVANAVSNVTSTQLNNRLNITKRSLTQSYRIGQDITYVITIENNSAAAINGLSISDDLGTYESNGNEITPLSVNGRAQLFLNGVFDSYITPIASDDNVIFRIPNITANSNAQIIYMARVNRFADGEAGATITNTATAVYDCGCPCDETVSDSNTVTAEEFAEVRIIKSVCPNPVTCGETLNYVIDIYNYGNAEATDVVLTDRFDPALSDITVSVNGVVLGNGDYSYIDGVLRIPSEAGGYEITVPAATFNQTPESCEVSFTPGRVQVIVSGTI